MTDLGSAPSHSLRVRLAICGPTEYGVAFASRPMKDSGGRWKRSLARLRVHQRTRASGHPVSSESRLFVGTQAQLLQPSDKNYKSAPLKFTKVRPDDGRTDADFRCDFLGYFINRRSKRGAHLSDGCCRC